MSTGSQVDREIDNGFNVTNDSKYVFLTESTQNKFDGGLIFGYGYSFDHNLQIGLDTWVGLTDLYAGKDTDYSAKNMMIRVSLNYWL